VGSAAVAAASCVSRPIGFVEPDGTGAAGAGPGAAGTGPGAAGTAGTGGTTGTAGAAGAIGTGAAGTVGTGGAAGTVGTGGAAGTVGAGGAAGTVGSGGGAGTVGGGAAGTGGAVSAGGVPVNVTPPASLLQAAAAERATIAADRPSSAAGFAARWPAKYRTGLPYDPLQAQGLDLLAASHMGVSDTERQAIGRDGFVISARETFPTFFYGYKAIYSDHLPLYVSLDSVMHAVHRSYDAALKAIEYSTLSPTLKQLLADMHAALASGTGGDLGTEVRADVDLYLTVARQLLGDTAAAPVAGADPTQTAQLTNYAKQADGIHTVSLFGQVRDVDFSQFKPRGHYANDPILEPYFRSMIWLGRTDLRFLQYDTSAAPDAPPYFFRRQFTAALLLAQLTDGNARLDRWRDVDGVLRAFVGESDNMTVADFPRLRQVAGTQTAGELAALSDDAIAQALLDGGFGIQRIASQILYVPPGGAGVPLDRVFLFFGQRFVIDSAVFSDVVFDRVRGEPKRMMPNPLDAAFGALGNNAATPLLATELAKYPNYPGALHDARRLVDAHGDDFWGGSLYTTWLGTLRGLSMPAGDPTSAAGLPAIMQTEPWARRMLNTQLASWAELRHDTLLYAKQSFTAIPSCDFPAAYVDPYPDAWSALVRMARLGQTVAMSLPASAASTASSLGNYFSQVETIARMLGGMAENERAGLPMTDAQLAFINQAVSEMTVPAGCATRTVPTGWYPTLFLYQDDVRKSDPTIADVHTDPADSAVLHVATGLPRLIYVTVDGCNGPRAYAGVVSSYFEKTTGHLQRLTDMDWSTELAQTPPAEVSWMAGLVAF
jgi:hypothetical protein